MAYANPASEPASYHQVPVNLSNQMNTTGGLDSTVKAWELLIGKPDGEDKFHPINPNKISTMNLPDKFKDRSASLGTAITMTTFLAPNPFTTRIAPIQRVTEMRFHFSQIEFQPQVAERVAHRAVTRLYTHSETSYTVGLHRRMVGHAIEAELATTEYGRQYLKRVFYQMDTSFAETMALEAMVKIQNSGDILARYEQIRGDTGSFMSFNDICQREIRNWDCAKEEKGKFFPRLHAVVMEYNKRFQNVNINTMVTSYAVLIHQALETARSEYAVGGKPGVDRFERGPFAETTYGNFTIVCPTSQRPGVGITDDLFTNRGMIGELADLPKPTDKYTAKDRTIRLLDMHTRRMEEIEFNDCLEHSALFDANGNLVNPQNPPNEFNNRDCKDPSVFQPNQTTFEPEQLEGIMTLTNYDQADIIAKGRIAARDLHGEVANGRTPNVFVGQMPPQHLTAETLTTMAAAVEHHFGRDRAQRYFNALSTAQSIIQRAKRTTVDDIATMLSNGQVGDLHVAGNTGNHDTLPSAGTLSDVYGAVDDDFPVPYVNPDQGGIDSLKNALVFPGFVDAAGFRAMRDAFLRGYCNATATFEKCVSTAQDVVNCYSVLEELANALYDICPQALVLNERLAPNVHRRTAPVDALFANFICYDFYPVVLKGDQKSDKVYRWPLYVHASQLQSMRCVNPDATGSLLLAADNLPALRKKATAFAAEAGVDSSMPFALRFAGATLASSNRAEDRYLRKARHAFYASEPLRKRFKEVWDSTTGNPLRRIVLSTLLFTPFNLASFKRLEQNNVPAPINFWVVSPHTQWQGKQVSVLEAGADTMVTFLMEGQAAMGFEAKTRMIYFNASQYMEVFIKKPEAIISLHNAFITTYICGASTHFFFDKTEGLKYYDPLVRQPTGRRSLIAIATSWTEKPPMYFALTGTLETSTVRYNTAGLPEASERQYNMAPYYCALFGFRRAKQAIRTNDKLRNPNQICLRASFDTWSNSTWQREQGNGHWKGNMDPDKRTITHHIATVVN